MAAEQTRRALLAQTGITCWFPRWSLPGAAPSHAYSVDAPAPVLEPVEAAPAPVTARSAGTPAIDGLRRVLPAVAEAPVRTALAAQVIDASPEPAALAVNVAEVAQDPRTSTAPVVAEPSLDTPQPFAFSWFALDKRLAVLCMLPSGASRLSGSCRQMLARLLAALHPSLQSVALSEQSFHWPFVEAPDLPADATAARQAVDAFVARRLREQNAALVLVLADEQPWFMSPTAESAPVPNRLLVHPRFGFAMLCTHSLHGMEQQAGLKREAWQALQLVRDRLARHAGAD